MLNYLVLVLNQNYEPLNVCNAKRAVILVWRGKAEILENGRGEIRSPNTILPLPSVIRLQSQIRRPNHQRRLTRREIFVRDRFTCQYCGKQTIDLTLDHIIPRHRGGQHTWENITSACKYCNHKKAGHTPEEVNMQLLQKPSKPHLNSYNMFYPYLHKRNEWQKYVHGYSS
jgi:5-methylcytosine-specific restriction endonuclease McrA